MWALRQIYPLGFFGCDMHNDHTAPAAEDKLAQLGDWYDYLEALGVGVVRPSHAMIVTPRFRGLSLHRRMNRAAHLP